ncbi:MAG TPA: glycosyltransferase family 1 protein [Chloroflexia bacterium]|nr:glycosyltransferase family 1 protein [Chloroflexia bacterium]
MHVGINAHLLAFTGDYRAAGLSKHIGDLITALLALPDATRYTLYLGAGARQRPADFARAPRARLRVSRWPTLQPEVRILWEQLVLPVAAARDRLDVLHCPVLVRPFVSPAPTVVTVHDLIFLRYPERFPAAKRLYLTALAGWSVRHARRLIAVSDATRHDLRALLGVPARRVTVVPNGVDLARFYPRPPDAIAAFRRAQGLPARMILYLGTLEPRKNLPALLRAYAAARPDLDGAQLVIGGGHGWFYEEIFRVARELGLAEGPGAVRFAGYVPDAELPMWYNSATAFVYPSEYEGFGLPVLEALACGVPTIAGNRSALPEVVGGAGLLVDPRSGAELAAALRAILGQPALAARLADAGPRQAARFPWAAAAQGTLAVYQAAGAAPQ